MTCPADTLSRTAPFDALDAMGRGDRTGGGAQRAPRPADRPGPSARADAPAASLPALLVRVIAAALAEGARAWRRERRVVSGLAALRELDDRMLGDLGIDRGAIEHAARHGRG
jgi:uncharacterized protein YjiS (DUF1127 family)